MSTNVQDELSTTVVDKYTQFQQTLVDISDAPSQKLKEWEITADIINQHLNEAAFKEAVIFAITSQQWQNLILTKKAPSPLQAQAIGLN